MEPRELREDFPILKNRGDSVKTAGSSRRAEAAFWPKARELK